MTAVRSIVVCADDAGWDPASDEVIAGLTAAGRVSAVSVLVDGPNADAWRDADLGPHGSLGLHLHLNWSAASGSRGLGRLLLDSHLHRLPASSVTQRLGEQLERFEALFGHPPDFVDGHQHVHALPGVRGPLLTLLESRYDRADRPHVRVPLSRRWRGPKATALGWLGGRRLAAELRARGWAANDDFAGAYDMARGGDYRRRMVGWLATLHDRGLVMVHPGAPGAFEHAEARTAEAAYLVGPDWPADLRTMGVTLRAFGPGR